MSTAPKTPEPLSADGEPGGSRTSSTAEGTTASGGAPKGKSSLVIAAEMVDRSTSLISGYLRKHNSQSKWQRRYFEVIGHYFVYYKTRDSPEMLCAMDLWKASTPELSPPQPAEQVSSEFSIVWDRHRFFRTEMAGEAERWVEAIRQVQAQRPVAAVSSPAFLAPGGGASPPPRLGGGANNSPALDWGKKRREGEEGDGKHGSGRFCSCVIS